jgi:hypothetical protein
MNIAASSLYRIYEAQNAVYEEELSRRFDEIDEAKREHEEAQQALIEFVREAHKPEPKLSPLQERVASLSDTASALNFFGALVSTTGMIALGANPYVAALSSVHVAADSMGLYKWLGKKISSLTGCDAATGKTISFGARTLLSTAATAASLYATYQAVIPIWTNPASTLNQVATSTQNALEIVRAASVNPELSWLDFLQTLRAAEWMTPEVNRHLFDNSLKLTGAAASAAFLTSSLCQLGAQRERGHGQLLKAQEEDLADEASSKKKLLTGEMKGVRRANSDRKRTNDILEKIASIRTEDQSR